MVSCFILDYMHLACLGVMKRLLSFWNGSYRKRHAQLSSCAIRLLSTKINEVKLYVPKEFNRKLRPMAELSYWKAAEFRMFLLYVGVAILKDKAIMSKQTYKHFIKFSISMRILVSPCPTDSDIDVSRKLLKEFCMDCPKYYQDGFMSYNVHSLIHLPDDCYLFGSLELINCFPFESYLGILKQCVHSGYKPFEQVGTHAYNQNENIVISMKKEVLSLPPGCDFK
uniref:Transposase domain-containing protein n=1 Tax=Phallusia mammillata TaxID=59560 RepID=A0A6F9DGM9_9ASCI|nr:transposase domain-containing protein [Phallusia mammillata]